MNTNDKIAYISNWIKDYALSINKNPTTLVIGVSGGVASGLTRTLCAHTGFKTRPLKDIISEIQQFFQIHRSEGTYPGGVHLEMTGQDVTECMGGLQEITDEDLKNRYHTYCDPRLNASQSLELAFLLSDFLKEEKLLSKQSSNL